MSNSIRFSKLRLQNWRNFRSVEVPLQRRVVLVGPNASGKSNFLDVFRFLHDIVKAGGGLEQAVDSRGGIKALRCLAARQRSDIEIDVRVSDDSPGSRSEWRYWIAISEDKKRPMLQKECIERDGVLILNRPEDPDDNADPERMRQTSLEQVHANKEFRSLAEFFESVRYLHIVPQILRDTNRYRGKSADPFGWDLLERISGTNDKTRKSYLGKIEKALKVAVPQLGHLEFVRDERGAPHLRGKYAHWRPQGAWQNEESFSDGTLRMLGLLWAVLDGTGPLLLEEPELSLHPGVVQHIPQMLARLQRRSGRQIMISTHSADLLSDEGLGLDEVLVLRPGKEGTDVEPAASLPEVGELLRAGQSMSDAVLPRTRPDRLEDLPLFAE